jgi:hypothetical protein
VVRAQALTFLLLTALWLVVERGRALLLLLPLTALWSNFHGGFVLGPLIILAYALESVVRRDRRRASLLAGIALASFAASLANPYGVSYWTYLAGALPMPRPAIVEWQRAALTDVHVHGGILLSLVLVVAKRPRPAHLVALAGAAAASLLHIRFAPLLGIAILITLSPSLAASFERKRPALALATMVLAQGSFLVGLYASWVRFDPTFIVRTPNDRYPAAAIDRLRREPPGNLAVFFNWGEFALYHLYPRHRVSIDGRYETVYPEEVVRANWDFTRGSEGSERFLDDYPADYALYPKASGALRLLESLPDWEFLEGDNFFALYRRR